MSEEIGEGIVDVPKLSDQTRMLVGIGIGIVVAVGVFLRFYTHSALWLDEALTVNRSRLPLGSIAGSVKQDGAPPLYYYLLHFWMELFGQSDLATRSLSGIIGVITIPVAWLVGNRLGGRVVAWTTLALVASAPFAVYYSTEARMYALVILLTGVGVLALHAALHKPGIGNLTAVAVVTAALLYSQYWALYLVAIVAIWLIASTWWTRRHQDSSDPSAWKRPFHTFLGVAVGGVLFLPWVPTFLYQSKHTGTPWAAPANFSAVINAVTGFTDNQGSASVAGTNQGRLLAVIYFAMCALALFGVARSARIIELDLHTRPRTRGLTFVVAGTLFAAIAGGLLSSSAFSSRYATVVFLPFIVLVALGTTTLLSSKVRVGLITVAVAAGMVSSIQNVTTQRTQAPSVAAVINAHAQAGDIIAFCPDQLGPDTYRVIRDSSRYEMTTFPRGTSPVFVDWVDYEKTVHHANVTAFVNTLVADAGTSHHIWLVWQPGYQTYSVKCSQMASALLNNPQLGGHNWVTPAPTKYYEPMTLTEFAPDK